MQIRRINAKDTYPIRHKMLRPGKPIEDCIFPGDDDEDQNFHLGAFVEGKLVSIASFYYKENPAFEESNQYQLRGMSTLEDYQSQGHSSELLNTAFPIIKQNFCDILWCNARVSASGFYQKVGFEKLGEPFEIKATGSHVLMFKRV